MISTALLTALVLTAGDVPYDKTAIALASAKKTFDAATAEFKKQCGAASVAFEVDLPSLSKRYDKDSALRDESSATERCAEQISRLAATCEMSRDVASAPVGAAHGVNFSNAVDFTPLSNLTKVRCTAASFVGALDALVAKHPEWSPGDRWTKAAKLHWEDENGWPFLSAEVALKDGVVTLGIFEGTVSRSGEDKMKAQLVDLEYARVLSGGKTAEWGRFAVVQGLIDQALKRFNKSCEAKATVEIDWPGLEKAWPGWDSWSSKGNNEVLEDVAVKGFAERVLADLADLCAKDSDARFAALKKVKLFRVTGDARGVKLMEAKRKKPKKSLEDLQQEVLPNEPRYIKPSFVWKGDVITYGLWAEVINPDSASTWLEGEISRH